MQFVSGTNTIEDFEGDLADLRRLLTLTERERTKRFLNNEIFRIDGQLSMLKIKKAQDEKEAEKKALSMQQKEDVPAEQVTQVKEEMGAAAEDKSIIKKEYLVYEQLSKYGWEQEGDLVKVYVTSGVDGIGKHDKQQIDCEFTDTSIDLRLLHFPVAGKHLKLKLGPLNGLIEPGACKLKVKSNSVTLELKKAGKQWWSDLKQKAKKEGAGASPSAPIEKAGEDPGASLMNMMKDLYENGDVDMKRTIAESWTKSQKDKAMGLK